MKSSTAAVSNELIGDIAYDLIVQIAPDEELIFEENRDAYFANPTKALAEEQKRDEEMGFGGEAVIFLTPFVLAVVGEVLRFLAEELQKALGVEIGEALKLIFTKYRPQAKGTKQAPPPLTIEQLQQVRQLAFKKARDLKLSVVQSNQLADALAGSLVPKPA